MSKYVFIRTRAVTCTLADLCWVLGVSRSGYHQWQVAAQQTFTRHARRYGTRRRLQAELQAEGNQVGRYALRTWLRASGQREPSARPLGPRCPLADPAATVAEKRPLGQPAPTCPNQVWVGDSAYLPLVGECWCYLAT